MTRQPVWGEMSPYSIRNTPEECAAAISLLTAYAALDLLPMLGLAS